MIHLSPAILMRINRWNAMRARDHIGSTSELGGYLSQQASACVPEGAADRALQLQPSQRHLLKCLTLRRSDRSGIA
jgi:hypothetical protein